MNSCSLLDEKGPFGNLMLSFLCRSHSLWRSIPGYDHAHYRRLYPSIIKDIEVEMHYFDFFVYHSILLLFMCVSE